MKVLLVANIVGGWPFIQELRDNLLKTDIEADVFDPKNNELLTSKGEKINFFRLDVWSFILMIPFLGMILKRIQNKVNKSITVELINRIHRSYNVIEIHYVASWHYFLLKKINQKKKVILFYWGSDLYVDKYYLKNPTHELSEYLVFSRKGMAEDFLKLCDTKYRDNLNYLNFGIGTLENIKKVEKGESISEIRSKIGIPEDSFVITCGHNARDLMQHELIIEHINKAKESLPDNYLLIFPFTYRFDINYYHHIKNILEKYDLKCKFILEFMSQEDVARLRILTDVHINFVTSDGLNASMLENMYANSVVINGAWLDYDTLHEKGIFYVQADIDSLFMELQNIFTNYSHYLHLAAKNKEIVYKYFSWDNAIKNWIGLYNKIAIE